MKIYIIDINPKSIKDKHFKMGNGVKKIKYELISKTEGYYVIKNDEILYLEPNINQSYELIKNYNGYDLLINKTKDNYVKVSSQLPVEYICTKIIEYKYKGSKLNLIVECLDESSMLETNIIPINFYLEYNEKNNENIDLNDVFLREELNMYLFKLK